MKKLNLLFLTLFFISCGKQTAPPLALQDTEPADTSNEFNRSNLPKAPEATFAATPVEDDIPDHGPTPNPEPVADNDVKDELTIEPILYEDFAWEKHLVKPDDFLIKIAKREYVKHLESVRDVAAEIEDQMMRIDEGFTSMTRSEKKILEN